MKFNKLPALSMLGADEGGGDNAGMPKMEEGVGDAVTVDVTIFTAPPNNPLMIPPVILGELGQVVNVLPGAVDVMVTTCGVLPPLNNPLLSEEHDMTVVIIVKVLVGAGKMLDNADGILMILLLLIGTADNAAV